MLFIHIDMLYPITFYFMNECVIKERTESEWYNL